MNRKRPRKPSGSVSPGRPGGRRSGAHKPGHFDPAQCEFPTSLHAVRMKKPPPPQRPRCPGCIRPMILRQNRSRTGGLPELHIFECSSCGYMFAEAVTGEAPIAERASALHLEAYTARH